jgi:hypothetical protein
MSSRAVGVARQGFGAIYRWVEPTGHPEVADPMAGAAKPIAYAAAA